MFKSWLLHRASEWIQAVENPTGRYEVVDASCPAVSFETVGVKDLTNSSSYPLNAMLNGPQSRYGRDGKKKSTCFCGRSNSLVWPIFYYKKWRKQRCWILWTLKCRMFLKTGRFMRRKMTANLRSNRRVFRIVNPIAGDEEYGSIWIKVDQKMTLALLYIAQHVSDVNTSTFRS